MVARTAGQPRRIGRAHDQRIAARVGQHRGAAAARRPARPGAGRAGPPSARRCTSGARSAATACCSGTISTSVLAGLVERGDDLADALQVVGVVGDDQRVAAGVGVDRVVGADQRPQHGHQVVRVLVAQREDLRDDLVAAQRRHVADRHRAGLQLGVGLGHHLQQAAALDHREAQPAQRRQVARGRRRARVCGCSL